MQILKVIGIASAMIILLIVGVGNLPSETNPINTNATETAPPGYPYFADGTHIIGQSLVPGTYRTRTARDGCYFARLAGFGGSLRDIISNENTSAPAIVTISPYDKGFVSRRCGIWTQDLSAITVSATSFGDGTYIVGTDIQAGTYRTNGGKGCYFSRLKGFGQTLDDIIANDNTDSTAIVTISPTDRGFTSRRCGTWTKIN